MKNQWLEQCFQNLHLPYYISLKPHNDSNIYTINKKPNHTHNQSVEIPLTKVGDTSNAV